MMGVQGRLNGDSCTNCTTPRHNRIVIEGAGNPIRCTEYCDGQGPVVLNNLPWTDFDNLQRQSFFAFPNHPKQEGTYRVGLQAPGR